MEDEVEFQQDFQPQSEQAVREQIAYKRQNLGGTLKNLEIVLDNPPYGTSEALKSESTSLVIAVLNQVRQQDVPNLVSQLSSERVDVLLKYLYRIMATEQLNVLQWHKEVVEVGGYGSIMRSFTFPSL